MLRIVICCIAWQVQNVAGIINGTIIGIEKRPYQVSLYVNGICGGAILTRKFIITAAHCVEDTPLGIIWAGSSVAHEGVEHRMAQFYIHPKYVNHDSLWTEYDVAMIELETELTYSASVQPVRLPMYGREPNHGSLCYLSGWGLTSPDASQFSNELRTVTRRIIGRQMCAKVYKGFAVIGDNMVCGGSIRRDKLTAPCEGDSGGPLICRGILAGIASWSGDDMTCYSKTIPYEVYANVANPMILRWIEEIIS